MGKAKGDEKGKKRPGGRQRKPYVPDESELVLVRSLLDEGFRIERMDSDGNCMFRSLAHQLFSDACQHMRVRQAIMEYIEARADHFSVFIEDDESFEVYVARMKTFGEWGDHTELYAAAQCFKVDIVIHQANTPKYRIEGSDERARRTAQLSFHGECHYNSVVAINPQSAEGQSSPATFQAASPESLDQQTVDLVARSLPWIDEDAIRAALLSTKSDVDTAIELLCSGAADLTLTDPTPTTSSLESPLTSTSATEADSGGRDVGVDESTSKAKASDAGKPSKGKSSKGGARSKAAANPVLSKKERRKQEKQPAPAPPPVPSLQVQPTPWDANTITI